MPTKEQLIIADIESAISILDNYIQGKCLNPAELPTEGLKEIKSDLIRLSEAISEKGLRRGHVFFLQGITRNMIDCWPLGDNNVSDAIYKIIRRCGNI